MPHKLIIDADPGIGDALAVALALLDPDIDLLAVTATAGCVSGPIATRNLQAVIELIVRQRLSLLVRCAGWRQVACGFLSWRGRGSSIA